jgi:putative aldouronate transport system permease protein
MSSRPGVPAARRTPQSFGSRLGRNIAEHSHLYLFVLPAAAVIIVFNYVPMYGIQIAFKQFVPSLGIAGSPWVGLRNFRDFVTSYNFWMLIRNTVYLSLYQLILAFPMPIVLALVINEIGRPKFKRLVQTVTYMPHFISVVVIVGMVILFSSSDRGLIGNLMSAVGLTPVNYLANSRSFRTVYVLSGVWQSTGWDSIIYLAAISGISPDLYEAARVDGANKWQKIRHIDLPGLAPTITILLILRLGRIMLIGFEKAFLMQNPMNLQTSEIISTYVYKMGLLNAQYSFGAAVGLFNTLINFILLITANRLSRRFGETSLW